MSAAHGPNTSTAVGEVVSVALSGDASFGVNFSPDASGIGAFVGSWDRVSGGKFGPIQSHGGVHLGDFLCALNDTQLDHIPFAEVMLIINDRNLLKKNLTFISSHRNRIR